MSLKSTAVIGSRNKHLYMETNNSQLVIYQTPQGDTRIDVRVKGDTIWLTQRQIAESFGTRVPAISRHLKNIYASGELHEYRVISKMETTTRRGAMAGKPRTYRRMRQNLNFYTTSCIKKISI